MHLPIYTITIVVYMCAYRFKNNNNNANNRPRSDGTQYCTDLDAVDKIMSEMNDGNAPKSWNKIDKTTKLKALTKYADICKTEKGITDAMYNSMLVFFVDSLDKKKLSRVKDVVFDKETCTVTDIPTMIFNTSTSAYTIKSAVKHVNTVRNTSNINNRANTITRTPSAVSEENAIA